MSAIWPSTSVSHACRSTSLSLAVMISVVMAAARSAPRSEPFDDVGVELDAAVVEDAGEPVPMIQAVTDGICDQGPPGDTMVGVTTVLLERGVGVVIVVTLPAPWMACLRVYALVV